MIPAPSLALCLAGLVGPSLLTGTRQEMMQAIPSCSAPQAKEGPSSRGFYREQLSLSSWLEQGPAQLQRCLGALGQAMEPRLCLAQLL